MLLPLPPPPPFFWGGGGGLCVVFTFFLCVVFNAIVIWLSKLDASLGAIFTSVWDFMLMLLFSLSPEQTSVINKLGSVLIFVNTHSMDWCNLNGIFTDLVELSRVLFSFYFEELVSRFAPLG